MGLFKMASNILNGKKSIDLRLEFESYSDRSLKDIFLADGDFGHPKRERDLAKKILVNRGYSAQELDEELAEVTWKN